MKLDAIIQWFMPREERFHKLFALDTANMVKSAHLFAAIAASESLEERRVKLVELKGLEHEGDQINKQIFDALHTSFITPLDREDIRWMANDLDDIVDYFESVATSLVLFELAESPEPLRQFAKILVGLTEELHLATGEIWNLGNGPRIHQRLVHISELENQADALYQTVIADLFRTRRPEAPSRDPIELLKWKEIYDELEDACDKCKDCGHVFGNILTKNA